MKNAFERRRDHRKLLAQFKTKEGQAIKLIGVEHRMHAYETAYYDYYQMKCKVSYKAGWYWVHSRRVRAEKLEAMTDRLLALMHERELNLPEEL